MSPLVGLGGRLSQSADHAAATGGSTVTASLLLGVATGFLWAPCAGPVLGLILTGAALQGASAHTCLLLLAYAAGTATSLALALLVGGRVLEALKRSLGVGEWIRRGVGVAVLAAVIAIALGVDTGFLTRVSLASTSSLEQKLLDTFHPSQDAAAAIALVRRDDRRQRDDERQLRDDERRLRDDDEGQAGGPASKTWPSRALFRRSSAPSNG